MSRNSVLNWLEVQNAALAEIRKEQLPLSFGQIVAKQLRLKPLKKTSFRISAKALSNATDKSQLAMSAAL